MRERAREGGRERVREMREREDRIGRGREKIYIFAHTQGF